MSLVFSGERLSPDVLNPSWQDQIRFLRERGVAFFFGRAYLVAEHLSRYQFVATSGLVEGRRVLDIACGIGYGAERLKKAGARSVIAGDLHFPSLKYGQETFQQEKLVFVQANGERLPFPADAFDLVVSLETIEHLNDPEQFLGEVRRVLTTRGIFIVSTPNRKISNPGKTLADQPRNQFHRREYSRSELVSLLRPFFSETTFFGQRLEKGRNQNTWLRRVKILAGLTQLQKRTKVTPLTAGEEPAYFVVVCR